MRTSRELRNFVSASRIKSTLPSPPPPPPRKKCSGKLPCSTIVLSTGTTRGPGHGNTTSICALQLLGNRKKVCEMNKQIIFILIEMVDHDSLLALASEEPSLQKSVQEIPAGYNREC